MSEKLTSIEISNLLLDPENPRLPASLPRDQQSMLDYISETTSIEELMEAISENDFFPGEPLIVAPHSDGKHIVVEGNRRLTALKLLQDPKNCSRPGERMRFISDNAKYKPKKVPVIICPTRDEVLPYLGYRHITGVKQWEPLAKARYIQQLFSLTSRDMPARERYYEVARAIGSRRDHIKRNLDALAVYDIIKDADYYGIEDLNDESLKFAVLSTAVADERIGEFVGTVKKDGDDHAVPSDAIINPKALNKDAIEELAKWLYARDQKGKTRVGESRNLRQLSAVVANPRALAAFRHGAQLKIAYQLTSDVTEDFTELLYQAEGLLTEAASMVATVQYDDDALAVTRRLLENIRMIGRELKNKDRSDEDEF